MKPACLIDYLWWPPYPLPTSLICSLEHPAAWSLCLTSGGGRWSGSGSRGPAWCPSSGTSLFQTLLGKKIFKFRVKREKRQELFFPVLQLSTFLLVSKPLASAFRCSLTDLKAKETDSSNPTSRVGAHTAVPLRTTSAAPASASFRDAALILMCKVLE